MSVGEIVGAVVLALFGLAFAMWARRIDKVLDLLADIRKELHTYMLDMERRVTTLEVVNHIRDRNQE